MQSKVLSNSDLLTPGNYSLYVGDELGQGYPFQLVDKSITQMVLSGNTNGTIVFITVGSTSHTNLPFNIN